MDTDGLYPVYFRYFTYLASRSCRKGFVMEFLAIGLIGGAAIAAVVFLPTYRRVVGVIVFLAATLVGIAMSGDALSVAERIFGFLAGFTMVAAGSYSTARYLYGRDYWSK